MLFDSAIMACCLDEISDRAVGITIRDCRQPRKLALVLELDIRDPVRYLTISAEAERARIHLADVSPKPSGSSYPMEPFCRKHLRGSRIKSVSQQGFDRVARIEVESRNPRLIDPVSAIVAELMGKHSNVFLLNNVDTILEALKHITPEMSRARTVQPHQDYEPPPTGSGRDPRGVSAEEILDTLAEQADLPVSRALGRCFDGLSRILAQEISHCGDVAPDRVVSSLGAGELARLARAMAETMDQIAEGRWEPQSFEGRRGPSHYAFPLQHMATDSPMAPVESLCMTVAHHAESDRDRGETSSKRAQVASAIKGALGRVGKRIAELERQADPEAAETTRHRAESLAASLHTLQAGVSEARVPDPYSTEGAEIVVPLDKKLGPAENVAKLFDRARRMAEGARRAPELLAAVERDRDALEECLDALEGASDADEFEQIVQRAERHGAKRGRGGKSQAGDGFPARASSDGYELVFGRSAEESDRLIREIAAPTDYWLHARDHRGGHVIIRSEKRPERVPRNTIEQAARLAAFLSKARHSALVPVDYTLKKYVRKARKGPPGLHIFEREKTLMVEPLGSADEPF